MSLLGCHLYFIWIIIQRSYWDIIILISTRYLEHLVGHMLWINVFQEYQRGPLALSRKTSADIANVIGYSPEINTKTILLKIPCTYLTENVEVKLVFNWKLQLYWLAFTLLEKKSNYQYKLVIISKACSSNLLQ